MAKKNVEWKPQNAGRPRDYQEKIVADTLARDYRNLTGKTPGTSKNNGGPFWSFLNEIFDILNIVHSKTGISRTLSRAARAASKLREKP